MAGTGQPPRRLEEALPRRGGDRFGARGRAQLRPHVRDVAVHRVLAEDEPRADLAVAQASSDKAEDLDLARRQAKRGRLPRRALDPPDALSLARRTQPLEDLRGAREFRSAACRRPSRTSVSPRAILLSAASYGDRLRPKSVTASSNASRARSLSPTADATTPAQKRAAPRRWSVGENAQPDFGSGSVSARARCPRQPRARVLPSSASVARPTVLAR